MKFSSTYALVGSFAPLALAFPTALLTEAAKDPAIAARAAEILEKRQSGAGDATALFEPVPYFDAKTQFIDVGPGSGHQYVAPSGNDNRGPCPGLNAFANHGFLPHNGYATIAQFVDATQKVVGMGPQLALFLAAFGAAVDGDGLAWSIGGTPTIAQAGILGNQAHGISGSHNKYEGDSSPTRPDLYQEGNDYKTKANQFQEMINMLQPGETITMESLTAFRSYRFDKQESTNPYWFNGPFTGVLVQPAAYTFIFRFMANHSSEHPAGLLTPEVMQTWFGISGSNGSYVANQGQEHIPSNWYRRQLAYPYEVEYFAVDVLNAAKLHPKFLNIGGNTGKVNTFTGVDVTDLTKGVYNANTLLEGNNAACFAMQFAAQVEPDVTLAVLNPLTAALGKLATQLSCPQLTAIDNSQLAMFPGAKTSNGGV